MTFTCVEDVTLTLLFPGPPNSSKVTQPFGRKAAYANKCNGGGFESCSDLEKQLHLVGDPYLWPVGPGRGWIDGPTAWGRIPHVPVVCTALVSAALRL